MNKNIYFTVTSRFLLLTAWILPSRLLATEFYVSPSGNPGGSGSITSPWDLGTAFGPPSSVRPGDTIWLRAGTYVPSGGRSLFTSKLSGTATQPVYVRQYAGERATLSVGLQIYGSYVWYWGFEIAQNNWTRTTGDCGSFVTLGSADAVYMTQGVVGNKLINLIVHDLAGGIDDGQEATGTETYGSLVYNVGWLSTCDRGHGHNLYMQNNTSHVVKLATDNIFFNSFDIGIQAYGSAPPITHMHFAGNVVFNSGLPNGHRVDNIVVAGGSEPKQDIVVSDSVLYNPLDAPRDSSGYNDLIPTWDGGQNIALTIQNTYWVGSLSSGYWTLLLRNWDTVTFQGNTVVGSLLVQNVSSYNGSGNTYYGTAPPAGSDPGSTVLSGAPTGVKVLVRPNKYEPGRANITVLNWDKSPNVTVDISAARLQTGQAFEVLDAQNFWGPPVVSGTYTGTPIVVPMNLSAVSPIQSYYPTPPHTSAEFGVFVLLPATGTSSPPPPVINSFTANPGFITGGQSATLSWSVGNATAVSINQGVGSVTGQTSISVSPATTTTYTLTASNSAGSVTQNATVTVQGQPPPPPAISSFTANPGSITIGQSSTLSWSVSNATSLSINQGVGSVIGRTSVNVSPSATATYTLTASNSGGSVTQGVTVTVSSQGTIPNLVGYWRLDSADISAGAVKDMSGNNLQAQMFGGLAIVAGKYGQALMLDGNSGYLVVGSDPGGLTQLTGDLTLAAWIKTSNNSRTEAILSRYDAGDREYGYMLQTTAGGNVAVRVGGFNLSSVWEDRNVVDNTKKINDGNWHHVAAVIRLGQNIAFYIDGQAGSTQAKNTVARISTVPLMIGVNSYTPLGNFFTGTLDEVRIYNRALAPAEVVAAMNNGSSTGANQPPVVSAGPNQTITLRTNAALNGSATDDGLPNGTLTVTWAVVSGPGTVTFANPNAAVTTASFSAVGSYVLSLSASDGALTTIATTTVTVQNQAPPPPPSPAGYWSFDSADISGGVANDKSGNNLQAQMNGGLSTVAGESGQALAFDGSSGYLLVNDPRGLTQLGGDLTLAAWIKTSNNSRTEAILSRYDASDTEYGYMLQTTASGNVAMRFGGGNLASSWDNREIVDNTKKVNDGTWHHVVAVIHLGQNIAFYIDGQPGSTQAKNTMAHLSSLPLTIGVNNYTPLGNFYTGTMDEVRIYNRALSAAEVLSLP